MFRIWTSIVCLLVIFTCFPTSLYSENFETKGKIDSVVLYRGQALVTRVLNVKANKGNHKLVVTDLPVAAQSDSLFANANKEVSIRAVRYRTRVVGQSPVASVRDLNKEIKKIQADIRENQHSQGLVRTQQQYIDSMKNFVIPTAKVEMSKGVLNPAALTQMMTYIFTETKKLSKESFRLNEELYELQQKLDMAKSKLSKLAGGSSKELREAVVFFENSGTGSNVTIELGYLVNRATWASAYNVRAQENGKKTTLEYSALVEQVSGEDWSEVSLTLSTASVGMSAEAPALAPMLVSLGHSNRNNRQIQKDYSSVMNQQKSAFRSRGRRGRKAQIETDWNLNKFGNDIQGLEFNSSFENVRSQQRRSTTGLTVNYKIPGKVSVTSRTDRQMVEIRRLQLASKFYNIARPLLSEYIYREALITNNDEIALLQGKANIYLDNQFVGVSTVPMTAKGQKFKMGFGIDSQFRTWRELVSKNQSIQGGNKIMEMKYRLTAENYKDTATQIRIFDRIPKSGQSLRVTVSSDTELSKDPEYLRTLRSGGILQWRIDVAGKAAAKTAHLIEYTIKLEFEKGLSVNTGVSRQKEKQMMEEFESNYE